MFNVHMAIFSWISSKWGLHCYSWQQSDGVRSAIPEKNIYYYFVVFCNNQLFFIKYALLFSISDHLKSCGNPQGDFSNKKLGKWECIIFHWSIMTNIYIVHKYNYFSWPLSCQIPREGLVTTCSKSTMPPPWRSHRRWWRWPHPRSTTAEACPSLRSHKK